MYKNEACVMFIASHIAICNKLMPFSFSRYRSISFGMLLQLLPDLMGSKNTYPHLVYEFVLLQVM